MIVVSTLLALVSMNDRLVFEGTRGPGKGKHIVFLSGDEEYRSEEGLPQLARIMSQRHGFKCTVLFSINAAGEVDPNEHHNQPGLEALDSADLCVMLLRFREWPDDQMKHFADYYHAGKPIIALRTSTHAFDYKPDSTSPYRKFGWADKGWRGGFGKQVLGETWVSHWGVHGGQATRGVVEAKAISHPVMRGVSDIFGTTDVYEAAPPDDSEVLLRGLVLSGMNPKDGSASGRKKTAAGVEQELNSPMMPIAWYRNPVNADGRGNPVLTFTMGAATDFLNPGIRRFIVNGAYWLTGIEKKISAGSNVDLVEPYSPTEFGFGKFKKGLKASDF